MKLLRLLPTYVANTNRLTAIIGICTAITITSLLSLHRTFFGPNGFGVWTSDTWSSNNSQFIADPYSLSHILHGMIFFLIFGLFAYLLPIHIRFLVSTVLEMSWEILENSPLIIDRYRQTAALGYTGDSILNSLGDIGCCMLGFYVATNLSLRYNIMLICSIEILMLILFRDNLSLNVLMLLYPIESIKNWQLLLQ